MDLNSIFLVFDAHTGGIDMSIECNEFGNVVIKRGRMINKRWVILSKLGEGGCGTVYKVMDVHNKRELALKAEANCIDGGSVLKLEAKLLNKLKEKTHFPTMHHAGKREKFAYIIMTLLGDPLSYLLKLHGGKQNTISTQVRVGINILHALKGLHEVGVVHRDIKPANLALGSLESKELHIVHILDFGLAREFAIEESGKTVMRRPREDCLFRGTARYCSINTHEKGDQGRVDDLWSMVYLLAEMRCPLPWAKLREKAAVYNCKTLLSDEMLFFDSSPKMTRITDHLRTLDYYSRPNYRLIYDCLMEIVRDNHISFEDLYDWEEKGDPNEKSKMETDDKEDETQDSSARRQKEGKKAPSAKRSDVMIKKDGKSDPPPVQAKPSTSKFNVCSSDTQEDAEFWGDFPASDFSTNILGF